MKFIYIALLLTVMIAYSSAAARCRDPNETYLECTPCAAINCGDTPPEVCVAACLNPGCFCNKGYLRKNGKCVPESQC
ncbi:chymotrypsin-elastase inhibitor ixodidin isoform X2 [Anoplophora glabripennis]|uniref:Putative chymotrypsin-elastase inhibitor n=2 Tax=Anoplophora glabripennis TaxID=217634 RepID=A0A2D1LVN9_ANOGL|nr:chymotrypsin-elastase inhibitor ixodidin isoform X2 [Anoplophora glabripennis]ATO58972.1 putative chymotrypsin-elastase inhibitor [Anoplophora glabripennis]